MRSGRRHFIGQLMLLVAGAAVLMPAWAQPTVAQYWIRPGVPQQVWQNIHALAFFPYGGDTAGQRFDTTRVQRALPRAALTSNGPAVIATQADWNASNLAAAVERLTGQEKLPAYAIYTTGPDGTGSTLILTGNILVAFRAGHDRSNDTAWLASNGLQRIRSISGGTVLFKAGAGSRALSVANALNNTADVAWAAPDWLRGNRTR